MIQLGKLLRLARKAENLTQQELAEKMYVSQTSISLWESDKQLPSLENMDRLIEVLPTMTEVPPIDDGAFGRCCHCDYEFNSELRNEYNIKFCPNCGTKISRRKYE